MNTTKKIFLVIALVMIAAAGVFLAQFKSFVKLTPPGVTVRPLPGAKDPVVEVVLPENVLDYTSIWRTQDAIVTNTLPADTSYGMRIYTAQDNFWIQTSVVLMGYDRTSHHKPQFCLTGAGWNIDPNVSKMESIHMNHPVEYDLPVIKLISTRQQLMDGKPMKLRSLYVYWFVSDNEVSGDESGLSRMWSMGKELVQTGVLHRWAYVSCFAPCLPGQEDATYERIKEFIKAATPQFQLVPGPAKQASAKP